MGSRKIGKLMLQNHRAAQQLHSKELAPILNLNANFTLCAGGSPLSLNTDERRRDHEYFNKFFQPLLSARHEL